METNVEWVLQSVLPVFLHPNEKVRNSLHIALQYCKKPIAYSIPDYLDDLTEQFKRKEISKDSIRFELAQIYSNLAIKFDGDDVSAQHFVQKSILFISVFILPSLFSPFPPFSFSHLLLFPSLLLLFFLSRLSPPLLPFYTVPFPFPNGEPKPALRDPLLCLFQALIAHHLEDN